MDKKKIKIYIYIVGGIIIAGLGFFLSIKNQYYRPTVKDTTKQEETVNVPVVESSRIVELNDGDSYDFAAGFVRTNIGGVDYKVMAYNRSVPGPLIKVKQGAEVTINFRNDTDKNMAFYAHGVRTGGDLSQESVKSGESFSYKLKFPDIGMFWYHPYFQNKYSQKDGLYGGFLVVPSEGKYWNEVNREEVVFLDDFSVKDTKNSVNQAEGSQLLLSRFGNTIIVNGKTDYSFSAKKGEVVRFYLINSAEARPFNFAISGKKLKLVGGDGGAYEKEELKDSVFIGPSERAIVEVLFDQSGGFVVQNITPDRTYQIGKISVQDGAPDVSFSDGFNKLHSYDAVVKSINPFRKYFNKAPDKQLDLIIGVGSSLTKQLGNGSAQSLSNDQISKILGVSQNEENIGIEWGPGNQMTDQVLGQSLSSGILEWKARDPKVETENMNISWAFKKNEPAVIRMTNSSNSIRPMQQSIHFHGQRFLVLNSKGNLVWKDTVFIPSGQSIDIILDASNPGSWIADSGYIGANFGIKVQ